MRESEGILTCEVGIALALAVATTYAKWLRKRASRGVTRRMESYQDTLRIVLVQLPDDNNEGRG